MAAPSFITEAPPLPEAEDINAAKKRLDEEYESHMELPRENARKLLEVAGQLNVQMKGLLEKEKQEFIAAYRAHTRKIQEDLARLRSRVAEEEESLHRDEKVKRLQGDRDSYRAQALELDTTNRSLSTQLETIKAKLEVLEDDRNFLVRSLKASQEKAAQNARAAEAAAKLEQSNKNKSTSVAGAVKGLNTVELLKSLRKTINDSAETNSHKSHNYLPPIGGDSPRVNMPPPGNDELLTGKSLLKKKEVESIQKAIASDRKQLELMAREVGLVQRRRQANWLEALLVDCIRRVADQVNERRQRNEDFGTTSQSMAVSAWGEAPLRLEKFTAPDRAAVLRLLLNDPRVQSALSRRRQQDEEAFFANQKEEPSVNISGKEAETSDPPARVSWMGGPGTSLSH